MSSVAPINHILRLEGCHIPARGTKLPHIMNLLMKNNTKAPALKVKEKFLCSIEARSDNKGKDILQQRATIMCDGACMHSPLMLSSVLYRGNPRNKINSVIPVIVDARCGHTAGRSATQLGFLGFLYGQLRNEMGWGGKGCGGGTSLTGMNAFCRTLLSFISRSQKGIHCCLKRRPEKKNKKKTK